MTQSATPGVSADSQPWSKRALDLVISALVLAFLAPLLALIGLLIATTSPGPILFRQKRAGLGGRPFEILKFRSMRPHEELGEVKQASRHDSRVTPVGAFLRRTSLDELPQLINVLKGDMSLVGPRPHALSHDDWFTKVAPDYPKRFAVKPGITGLAQVNGCRGEIRSEADIHRRTEWDVKYAAELSIWADVRILAKTALIVFVDENAY